MCKLVGVSFLVCAFVATGASGDEALRGLREAIERGDFPKTNAVLVMRAGTLVYEGYFGDGGPEVLNDTRSAMKSVTSLAVGLAMADKRLSSVKQPAFPILADLAPF